MDPDIDPRPNLYSIGSSVSPEVMQRYGEWLERKSLGVAEAAELFGVGRAELDEVLAERAPMTADLALRMQAAGGMPAIICHVVRSRVSQRTGTLPVGRCTPNLAEP